MRSIAFTPFCRKGQCRLRPPLIQIFGDDMHKAPDNFKLYVGLIICNDVDRSSYGQRNTEGHYNKYKIDRVSPIDKEYEEPEVKRINSSKSKVVPGACARGMWEPV